MLLQYTAPSKVSVLLPGLFFIAQGPTGAYIRVAVPSFGWKLFLNPIAQLSGLPPVLVQLAFVPGL